MKSAGLKAIENARQNGSWEKAYESQGRITVPEDLKQALGKKQKSESILRNFGQRESIRDIISNS